MRPARLLAAVVAVSSLAAAWPDVLDSANALAEVKNVLYGRQDNSESESSTQPTRTSRPAATSSAEDEEATNTGDAKSTGDAKETDAEPSATGKESGKQSGSRTTSGSGTQTSKPKSYGQDVPPGGVSMITPAPIAGLQYYKIKDWVTFVFNFTSIKVTPSAIDILASCTANQATYTLAVNQTVQETNTYLWDTGAFQATASVPLLTENYKLMIYDSESSVSAIPQNGYLAPFSGLQFGMYVPKPPVDWEDFECANCLKNFGLSSFEQLTLKALLITSGTTFASLIYFAFSFGVL